MNKRIPLSLNFLIVVASISSIQSISSAIEKNQSNSKNQTHLQNLQSTSYKEESALKSYNFIPGKLFKRINMKLPTIPEYVINHHSKRSNFELPKRKKNKGNHKDKDLPPPPSKLFQNICNRYYDCFNCTLTSGCQWKKSKCNSASFEQVKFVK